MNVIESNEMIAAAKRNAVALCLAQLDGVNEVVDAEALRVLGEIWNDADSLYVLLRTLCATIDLLALDTARAVARDDGERRHMAGQSIRDAIDAMKLTASPRPG